MMSCPGWDFLKFAVKNFLMQNKFIPGGEGNPKKCFCFVNEWLHK
jgi:hypothetical protein